MSEGGRSSSNPAFLIGQDSCGRWVVQDCRGLSGGLFISREEAVRFAIFESDLKPQAVVMVPYCLELRLDPPAAMERPYIDQDAA